MERSAGRRSRPTGRCGSRASPHTFLTGRPRHRGPGTPAVAGDDGVDEALSGSVNVAGRVRTNENAASASRVDAHKTVRAAWYGSGGGSGALTVTMKCGVAHDQPMSAVRIPVAGAVRCSGRAARCPRSGERGAAPHPGGPGPRTVIRLDAVVPCFPCSAMSVRRPCPPAGRGWLCFGGERRERGHRSCAGHVCPVRWV